MICLNKRNIQLSLIPFIVLLGFLMGAYASFEISVSNERQSMIQHLAITESNINEITTNNYSKMLGVSSYVSLNTNFDIDDLNYFVQNAVDSSENIISNIGIFEDTTAVYLYPYEANEDMSNINLAEISSQRDDALRVKEFLEVVITPPVELVQGGTGIMTRMPILLTDGTYWGQLGYMMVYEDIISSLSLNADKYSYLITQYDNGLNESHIVYDSGFGSNYLDDEIIIKLPSGYWGVQIGYDNIFELTTPGFYILIVTAISLFIGSWYLIRKFTYEKDLALEYLNIAEVLMLALDKNGDIIFINRKGCEILGVKESTVVGVNWFDTFIPKHVAEETKNKFKETFEEENIFVMNFQNEIITSSEEVKLIDWKNSLLRDTSGNIIGLLSSGEDITELKKKEDELIHISYHDQLTGLYNRRFFEEQIKILDNPRNLPLSIIMGDVNGLKLVNDAFGHNAGDKLLKMIGEIISTSIRGNDVASRWGGDEFTILLPNSGAEAAEKLITRIQKKIQEASFEYGILSISFGAETKQEEQEDIKSILTLAEELMYQNKLVEIDSIRGQTINTIMTTLFEKSPEVKEHSTRVSELSASIAEKMGLSKIKVVDIKTMGLVHDIGKIATDLHILDKPGELTSEERKIIEQHPLSGSRMLNSSHEYSRLAAGVLHHHERIDGTGYPNGLTGEQIPIESKIIAVADAFDSMTAERPYRINPLSIEEAIDELIKHSGTQFDKDIVDVFVNKVIK